MSDETKQEVVTTQAAGVPAVHDGQEALGQMDYEIPRAKIVQFTSAEAQAENVNDRVQPGTFINSLSKKEIPTTFIPLFVYKTYTQWNPVKKDDINFDPAFEPGALIFSTKDRHDPRITSTRIMKDRNDNDVEIDGVSFGPNGEAPLVTESYNYLCCFEGQNFPLLLSFQKTSHKTAKVLNTLIREACWAPNPKDQKPMYENKYRLTFEQESNAGNKYYVMKVRAAGKSSADEISLAQGWFNSFKNVDIEAKAQKTEAYTE